MRSKNPDEGRGFTDLPTGLSWKASDLHAVRGTSRTGSSTLGSGKCIPVACTTSELNSQAFTHEIGTMESCEDESGYFRPEEVGECTRHHITSIHSIFVFDETEAIHEFDLGNLSGAVSIKVVFNIGFSCCVTVSRTVKCQ